MNRQHGKKEERRSYTFLKPSIILRWVWTCHHIQCKEHCNNKPKTIWNSIYQWVGPEAVSKHHPLSKSVILIITFRELSWTVNSKTCSVHSSRSPREQQRRALSISVYIQAGLVPSVHLNKAKPWKYIFHRCHSISSWLWIKVCSGLNAKNGTQSHNYTCRVFPA